MYVRKRLAFEEGPLLLVIVDLLHESWTYVNGGP